MDVVEKLIKIADAAMYGPDSPYKGDSPLGEQCREAAAEITRLRSELDAAYERAAKVIDDNQEAVSSLNNERYLQPRRAGNLMGTAYASSIRSLKSGGDRDHG